MDKIMYILCDYISLFEIHCVFLYWYLKDSNGNLELAVAFLTAKNAKTPPQEETGYYQTALPGNDRYISVGSQADASKFFFSMFYWYELNFFGCQCISFIH